MLFGSTQHSSDSRHHFKAAKVADGDYGVYGLSISPIELIKPINRLLQHFVLMTDTWGVEACASTDTLFQRDVAEKVHPDAAGRSIGNAHLANGEHTAAFTDAVIN